MNIAAYFASLDPLNLLGRLPGGAAQGIVWGVMALGVYITFRLLDVADLTVDGSFTTGGAVTVMLILAGWPAWAALLAAVADRAAGRSGNGPAPHPAGHSGHSGRHPDPVLPVVREPAHHGRHEGRGQQGRQRGHLPDVL
jgi:hypothetical protein